ncbi:hypothetical protein B0H11DRAFT_911011 [Mycena galericulata]|nr:hypothetical protein B0H11DRAFT_911011 [Mycena galericulata]
MAHALRVPQIDLSAILAEQKPQIDLRIESYQTSTRNFLKAVANYKTRTTTTLADRRAAHVGEKKRTLEGIGNTEAEMRECKKREIQLVSDLQREQEERNRAKICTIEFNKQLSTLRDRCAAIDSQIEHYRAIAANLQREKKKERDHLDSLAARSTSEVKFLESRLACVVQAVTPNEDKMLVRMSNIDPSYPDRPFSFVLDVSGSSYEVVTASPSTLPLLGGHLYDSKDPLGFLKDVRQAYVNIVPQIM